MARQAQSWLTSDQLTALGLLAQIGAGLCYALARSHRFALLGVIVCIAIKWLGDSLDGTLARVRDQQRPRYGFYVDHMVDLALLRSPYSTVLGHRMLLFDLGGTIATVCIVSMAILLTLRHTAQLYREEPLP